MLFALIAFILLIFLPGAWITFGLRLKGLPFWARLSLGVILAPLVVPAQFYLIRLFGLAFEPTAILLLGLNLPALYLIATQANRAAWRELLPGDPIAIASAGFVLLTIVICIAPLLFHPQRRLYTWEAWTQADVVYTVAGGNLDLEDAELAGVRLSYPWVGHVYQAILSYWVDTPPVTNYIWPNLIWLIVIFAFAAGIVAELGGNELSQVTVAVWLSFGVNFVGSTLGHLIPGTWMKACPILTGIWGDNRYTPWLDKVVFFGQMYFGMGIFIAILYLMIRPWPEGCKRYYVFVAGLLLSGLGVIYPVLLPAACVVIGARGLTRLRNTRKQWGRGLLNELAGLGIILVVAVVVTFAYTRFLTAGRTGAALFQLNDRHFMRVRVVETIVVMSPLLVGMGVVLGKYWKKWRGTHLILGLGALVSCVLYVLFDIPWWRNEYKFIFTAAICLAPFPSLSMQAMLSRLGRMAFPAVAVLTLILAAPFAHNIYRNTDAYTRRGPLIDVQHFDLRLDDRERLAGLVDAIRERTPVNSLLVLENAELYFPTLTRRHLYVAPTQTEPHPGILITSDQMLKLVKGYPLRLVADRRSIVRELFGSDDPQQIERAVHEIQKLNRPLALVLDEQQQAVLLRWLTAEEIGKSLYQADGLILWLIQSTEP